MHVHVDADEVDELARAHRPAGAVLHADVEISRCHARLVEHADAVVQQRDEHSVDDEARGVVAADRVLAELLAQRERSIECRVGGELRADDLDQRHQRRGIEEMHADDARRRRRRRRDLGHRQGRGVRRQHRVPTADALELGEELALRAEFLHDRLDDEVAVGEVGELGRRREEREVERLDLALLDLARQEVADAVACALPEVGGHLQPDGLDPRFDAELRDARAHGPQADDSDFHRRDPNRGPSTMMTPPATTRRPSAALRPTPRATKPIAGPLASPPV